MADEVPIIIGSDEDDSDSDDVVLVKEEIEVEEDNDDVIFLSETKPTVTTDLETKERPELVLRSQSEPAQSLDQPPPLHRSISINTGTRQISLDDNQDTGSSYDKIPQLSNTTNFSGPLDLSSKSCDTLLPASGGTTSSPSTGSNMQQDITVSQNRLSVLNNWHNNDNTDITDSSNFASARSFGNTATVLQCSTYQPCTLGGSSDSSTVGSSVPMDISSYTDITVLPGGFITSTAMLPQLDTRATPAVSVCDQGCSAPLTSSDCSRNSSVLVTSFYSNHHLSSPLDSCDTKTSLGVTVGPGVSSLCDSSGTKQLVSSDNANTSLKSADQKLTGHNAFLCTDSTSLNTTGASTSLDLLQSSGTTSIQSSSASDTACTSSTATTTVADSQKSTTALTLGSQTLTQVSSLSSSVVSSSVSADLSVSSTSSPPLVPGASGLVSTHSLSVSSTKNTVIQSPCNQVTSVSDPFAASPYTMSSVSPTLGKCTASEGLKLPVTVTPSTSLACSLQPQTSVQSSVTNTASNISGLPGGSSSFVKCAANPSPVGATADLVSKPHGFTSSYTRSFNTTDTNQLYNPLTLPMSMQNQQLKQSLSLSALSNKSKSAEKLAKRFSFPRSPPSCASFSLPPKKQKRCYSEGNSTCANCSVTLVGEKFSRCPNGHTACAKCLEEKVKLLLTGKAKESVRCLNRLCDSFYPVSELRLSLPSIVVEILEDKLDQEYVDYISDMMMRNASGETDQPCSSNDTDQETITEYKKDESFPEYWSSMDERVIQKKGYCLVKLEEDTPEYEEVVLQFFQSMIDQNVEVTSVHRVQNPIQWKYYCVKKSEILQDNDGVAQEKQLFHGTSSTVVDAICRRGFDWRVCGKHGTLFGQGSYFAVHASYSHQYTDLKQLRPHGSSMMLSNPMSMTLPTTPSLFYPPVNVNFGQPLNSMSFTALNLSHNATGSSLTGSAFQPAAGTNSQNPSSSQSLQVNSPQSQIVHSSIGSVSIQSQSSSSGHRFSMGTRLKVLSPQAAVIRTVSGHPSYNLISSSEGPKKTTAKVFLAKVLIGKYVKGNPKLRKPPPLNPQQDPFGKCYDSCVDETRHPKIFVIFDSAQAYPEYLLEYSYSVE